MQIVKESVRRIEPTEWPYMESDDPVGLFMGLCEVSLYHTGKA
jgi:hypothetical protein